MRPKGRRRKVGRSVALGDGDALHGICAELGFISFQRENRADLFRAGAEKLALERSARGNIAAPIDGCGAAVDRRGIDAASEMRDSISTTAPALRTCMARSALIVAAPKSTLNLLRSEKASSVLFIPS